MKRRFFVYKKFAAKRYRHSMSKTDLIWSDHWPLRVLGAMNSVVVLSKEKDARSAAASNSCSLNHVRRWQPLFCNLCPNTWDTLAAPLVWDDTIRLRFICARARHRNNCRACIIEPLVWSHRKAFADCRLEWIESLKPDVVIWIYTHENRKCRRRCRDHVTREAYAC